MAGDNPASSPPAHEAYSVVGTPQAGALFILCDHASNHVPDDIDLGFTPYERAQLMQQHMAYDIGIAAIAEIMCESERNWAYMGAISRLVCDYNRAANDPAVIPEESDGHAIPGNIGIDREARIARFYNSYHQTLDALLAEHAPRFSLVLHSYTPALRTKPDEARPWECGVVYDHDPRGGRLAEEILRDQGFTVGDQEPYSGKIYNSTIKRHFETAGRPYLYIEVRQDLVAERAGQAEWAARLTKLCDAVAQQLPASPR